MTNQLFDLPVQIVQETGVPMNTSPHRPKPPNEAQKRRLFLRIAGEAGAGNWLQVERMLRSAGYVKVEDCATQQLRVSQSS